MLTGKPKPCNWHGNPVGSIILYNKKIIYNKK